MRGSGFEPPEATISPHRQIRPLELGTGITNSTISPTRHGHRSIKAGSTPASTPGIFCASIAKGLPCHGCYFPRSINNDGPQHAREVPSTVRPLLASRIFFGASGCLPIWHGVGGFTTNSSSSQHAREALVRSAPTSTSANNQHASCSHTHTNERGEERKPKITAVN